MDFWGFIIINSKYLYATGFIEFNWLIHTQLKRKEKVTDPNSVGISALHLIITCLKCADTKNKHRKCALKQGGWLVSMLHLNIVKLQYTDSKLQFLMNIVIMLTWNYSWIIVNWSYTLHTVNMSNKALELQSKCSVFFLNGGVA